MKQIPIMTTFRLRPKGLFLIISLSLLLMVPLQAQVGSLTLNVNNVTLKEALKQIEAKTTYTFLYQDDLLKGSKPVQLKSTNQALADVLRQVLKPSNLTYEVDDNVIILKRLPPAPQVTAERVLTGRILDNENKTLPGATIKQKDRQEAGVVSDLEGNFSISIPTDNVVILRVSFVGMETKEVMVAPELQRLDIKLAPSDVLLKDFVVVGAYGTQQKRSDLVGSAFQVNAKQLETLPVGRIQLYTFDKPSN